MELQSNHQPEHGKPTERHYTDVSQDIHTRLVKLRQEYRTADISPRNLYVRPNITFSEPVWQDAGCRGGHYTYEDQYYGDTYEVTQLSVGRSFHNKEKVYFKTRSGQLADYHSINLTPSIRFYESNEEAPTETIDQNVKERLRQKSFASFTADTLAHNLTESELQVRAHDPFSHPITYNAYRRNDEKLFGGEFHTIDSYTDENGETFVKISLSQYTKGSPTTDWWPLESVEFYTEAHLESMTTKLYRLAMRAVENEASLSQANQQLQDELYQYELPKFIRRESKSYQAGFVLGRIAANNAIYDISTPMIDNPGIGRDMALAADELVLFNHHPWLIDRAINLATPITTDSFKVRDPNTISFSADLLTKAMDERSLSSN